VRFENKNIFFSFEKTLHPTTTLALCIVVNFKVVGLVAGPITTIVSYNASSVKTVIATNSLTCCTNIVKHTSLLPTPPVLVQSYMD
jgi:hypothetical protein